MDLSDVPEGIPAEEYSPTPHESATRTGGEEGGGKEWLESSEWVENALKTF